MSTLASMVVKFGADLGGFRSGIRVVSEGLKGVETATKIVDIGMKAMKGAAIAGFGALKDAISDTISVAAEFESSMAKVQALSGAVGQEFQNLRSAAIDMSRGSVFSAKEVADGMSLLAAAGYDASQVIGAIPGVLNAAAASGAGFQQTTDMLVATLSAFELGAKDAAHVADVLAQAANSSAITMADLGSTLRYAGPVAHAAGVSLEELAAAAEVMGNAGIKASMAGTALRSILTRLADPPKAAREAIEQLGLKVNDLAGNMLPLDIIIGQLHNKFALLSKSQQVAMAGAIAGKYAMAGFLSVVEKGPEAFIKFRDENIAANGTSKEMADIMNATLPGAILKFKSSLSALQVELGGVTLPGLRSLVETVTSVISSFGTVASVAIPEFTAALEKAGPEIQRQLGWFGAMLGIVGQLVEKLAKYAEVLQIIAKLKGIAASGGPEASRALADFLDTSKGAVPGSSVGAGGLGGGVDGVPGSPIGGSGSGSSSGRGKVPTRDWDEIFRQLGSLTKSLREADAAFQPFEFTVRSGTEKLTGLFGAAQTVASQILNLGQAAVSAGKSLVNAFQKTATDRLEDWVKQLEKQNKEDAAIQKHLMPGALLSDRDRNIVKLPSDADIAQDRIAANVQADRDFAMSTHKNDEVMSKVFTIETSMDDLSIALRALSASVLTDKAGVDALLPSVEGAGYLLDKMNKEVQSLNAVMYTFGTFVNLQTSKADNAEYLELLDVIATGRSITEDWMATLQASTGLAQENMAAAGAINDIWAQNQAAAANAIGVFAGAATGAAEAISAPFSSMGVLGSGLSPSTLGAVAGRGLVASSSAVAATAGAFNPYAGRGMIQGGGDVYIDGKLATDALAPFFNSDYRGTFTGRVRG